MIKIAVISDIHCHEKGKEGLQGGYYFPSMCEEPIPANPFASLKELIFTNKIEYDYLLSPGDYAHQIDEIGLKSSWDQLKLVTHHVKAKYLLGTIGNHDVSSRSAGDSFKWIKEFDLDFPVYSGSNLQIQQSKDYRSLLLNDGYYLIDDDDKDILFIVVNSCYDHWNEVESSKGKIGEEFLRKIQNIISKSKKSKKLLMVHHQPIVHETGIHDTGDLIEGSEDFMKEIKGVDMVIHGHKHDFRFTQFNLYPKNTNILAAGSFSCFKTSLKTNVQNSFHEIQYHTDKINNCVNHGIIKTYLYDPFKGWELNPGLEEGFGCVLGAKEIQKLIVDEIEEQELPFINWDEIVSKQPVLKYITRGLREDCLDQLIDKCIIKRYSYGPKQRLTDIIIK